MRDLHGNTQHAKVLVTGGLGYIGSHTVVELMQSGFEVVIVDDLSNSRVEVLEGISQITGHRPVFHKVDLCNEKEMRHLLKCEKGIEAVIHFAASKAVGESVEQPLKYYRNNLVGLINLVNLMQESQVKSMVFSSSCTVYGQPKKLPVNEQSPFLPAQSPYGNTKQVCEEILRDYVKAQSDFGVVALRYFNPAGAHPSGAIGEYPLGKPTNLVPVITQSAHGKTGPFKVYGDDYNTVDGSAVRDYIHVVDLARAHVKAMELRLGKQPHQAFLALNVGTGHGVSVLEIIKAFEQANGLKLNYQIVDRRPGDIEKVYADATLVKQTLGWKPEYTLADVMRDAWNWQQQL